MNETLTFDVVVRIEFDAEPIEARDAEAAAVRAERRPSPSGRRPFPTRVGGEHAKRATMAKGIRSAREANYVTA